MLRIDLRVGERIKIGDDIVIILEEKSGQCARLSVDAPRSLEIKRTWSAANDNTCGKNPTNSPPRRNRIID